MPEVNTFLQSLLTMVGKYGVILIVSYAFTALAFPFLSRMIRDARLLKPNYLGEMIPAILGLAFVVLIPLMTGLGMLLNIRSFTKENSFLFLFVVLGSGFLGLIDDFLGNHDVKGFKGHFKALIHERVLTSGGFKAIFGAILAFTFSVGSAIIINNGKLFIWNIIIDFLLVVLAANTINLFDLRPGRAGKVFIAVYIIVLALSKNFEQYTGLFVPILAIIFYYLPFDLRGEVMMGDVGSNLLGASLGIMMAWMLGPIAKIVAVLIMVALQLLAEKFSFTAIIEQNPALRYLDMIGRRKS